MREAIASAPARREWSAGLLAAVFPDWTITRQESTLRAERPGFRTRTAQSPGVMATVLSDANLLHSLREANVSWQWLASGH